MARLQLPASGAMLATFLLLIMQATLVPAITVDPASPDSLKAGLKQIATEMMGYYTGDQPGQTPGYLPGNGQKGGYYWWVGGGMFDTMVNYWRKTGDDTWLPQTTQAIYFQSDPTSGGYFDSQNVSLQLGNDDQAFWAFAAMSSAEYKVPNPPSNYPSWLAMAQGVFNQQVQRWDPDTCGGGMRWQVFQFNQGYDYKNSISNGCFFNLAARLGKYTGNSTYIDNAAKWYDWSESAGLISSDFAVVDGIVVDDCSDHGHVEQWTYNVGVYLYGAAAMFNITSSLPEYSADVEKWRSKTQGLVDACDTFFKQGPDGQNALTEVICEPQGTCKVDSSTFKAYLARWAYEAANVAPFAAQQIHDMFAPSITAAATSCSGPPTHSSDGAACGQRWYTGSFDGKTGIGEQMTAMEALLGPLPGQGPVDVNTGISKGDSNAGTQEVGHLDGEYDNPVLNITTGDKAGAAFLTIALCAASIAGAWWILR